MMRGFFVTGTDAGVGKTVVSAALMHRLRGLDRVRYWQPIATGYPADDDTATVERLTRAAIDEVHERGLRFALAAPPHLAARHEGSEILLRDVLATRGEEIDQHVWIVEGAAGPRTPINDSQFMSDLIQALDVPAVVVCRHNVTINQLVMTIESLRNRMIELSGVVLVGHAPDLREAVAQYCKVPLLGEMPILESLDADSLREWATTELDRGGVLEKRLLRWQLPRGLQF
jgi:dethiobiotin synthetase